MCENILSEGKKAVLKRARQLTEFEWTPVCDVPIYTKQTGKTDNVITFTPIYLNKICIAMSK